MDANYPNHSPKLKMKLIIAKRVTSIDELIKPERLIPGLPIYQHRKFQCIIVYRPAHIGR
jgi:hypothetical protein